MLEALKPKPYDLEPVYVSWPDAPRFTGDSKDDPVAWLKTIKSGCQERKVPKEYWHRVGMHFMGRRPRERIGQLEAVMQQMTNQKNVWNWKKFKIAVQNLGFSSPTPNPKAKTANPPITERPMPKKQGSWWVIGKADSSSSDHDKEKTGSSASSTTTEVIVAKTKTSSPPQTPTSTPVDSDALTTVSKAPAWMVNACQALDFLTSEHPKVMSAMSAILLTIGAIPSIPAISAGAGGAFLASSAVQAAGAVAMGVGQALKAMQDGQVKVDAGNQSSA